MLYLLRGTAIEGSLTDNPYLRSLGVPRGAFTERAARVPGVRVVELGGAVDITWLEPSLTAYAASALQTEQP